MLLSMWEPSFPTEAQDALSPGQRLEASDPGQMSEAERYVWQERVGLANHFFLIYGLKVLVTTGLLAFYWRTYLRQFPFSMTGWSLVIGAVGIVVWVGLCNLGLESMLLGWFSSPDLSLRSQFNPFSQLPESWQLVTFLGVRFFGLVVMVPICEELLLRGFLMRYVDSPEWWTVSLARLSWRALLVAPLYGVLTHPAEALAAIAWFSLVTWLVQHTGKFWDAVVAHGVTNLLLGLYVCYFGQWQLW